MVYIVILNVETSSSDFQDCGNSNLANPHLVDDLEFHAGAED